MMALEAESEGGRRRRVRVWDLPTRLFHVLLGMTVTGALATAWIGGEAMVWHFRLGESALALLAFRLAWGFIGGRWSRFSSFVHGPGPLLRYLRRRHRPGERFDVGHSPTGALSVLAMLLALAAQALTGLVADDEIDNVGPLNRFVSTAVARAATHYHVSIGQPLVIALLVLHIAAVLAYRFWWNRDLISPMVHGDAIFEAPADDVEASKDGAGARVAGLLVCGVSAALIYLLVRWGGQGS